MCRSFIAFMLLAVVAILRPAAPAALGLGTVALIDMAWLATIWHGIPGAGAGAFLPSMALLGGLGVLSIGAGLFVRRQTQEGSDGFRLAIGALVAELGFYTALGLLARARGAHGYMILWPQMLIPSAAALLVVVFFGRRKRAGL